MDVLFSFVGILASKFWNTEHKQSNQPTDHNNYKKINYKKQQQQLK